MGVIQSHGSVSMRDESWFRQRFWFVRAGVNERSRLESFSRRRERDHSISLRRKGSTSVGRPSLLKIVPRFRIVLSVYVNYRTEEDGRMAHYAGQSKCIVMLTRWRHQ